MNGRECIERVLSGRDVERLPCLPIVHAGLAPLFGVSLEDFATQAEVMAEVIVRGYRAFGYDGVQLSLGVIGEAEALGAPTRQPAGSAPVLSGSLVPDMGDLDVLDTLRGRDPTTGGRMPLFYQAVQRTVDAIGDEAFVLATLRGPLLAASQLCGVENLLIAMLTAPDAVARVLEFTTEVALRLGAWLLDSGAHGLILGEATCSPNFISPRMYRETVLPYHTRLVEHLKRAGWRTVGLHICGNIVPIFEDIVATGVNLVDVDYQVCAQEAVALAQGRVACRGNLDPSAVFRFGTPDQVQEETAALCQAIGTHTRWILSSGCDVPPDTPAENVTTFVRTCRELIE